jgi:hypothetical protein
MSDNNNKTRLEEHEEEESESVNVLRNFVTNKEGKGNDTELIKHRVTAILIA